MKRILLSLSVLLISLGALAFFVLVNYSGIGTQSIAKVGVTMILYVIITVIRQIIEPRIVGDHVGLHPLLTLMCMFVGLRVFGGMGLLGLPILCAVLVGLERDGVITLFPKRKIPLPEEARRKKRFTFFQKKQKKL